jgi:rubrerythrin
MVEQHFSRPDLYPIPAIGLQCPSCGYNLTGLTVPRCPDCGQPFDVQEVFQLAAGSRLDVRAALLRQALPKLPADLAGWIDHLAGEIDVTLMSAAAVILQGYLDWKNGYRTTAEDWSRYLDELSSRDDTLFELPRPPRRVCVDFIMPDCDVVCPHCEESLAGAVDSRCPSCRRRFDSDDLLPRQTMVSLPTSDIGMVGLAQVKLESEGIPTVRTIRAHWTTMFFGGSAVGGTIHVPRSYYFDAVDCLHSLPTRSPSEPYEGTEDNEQLDSDDHADRNAGPADGWVCSNCGEPVPGHFETCWNCGHQRTGS